MGARSTQLDLLIVGTGPAGVACALHAVRAGLRVVIVGDEALGGLLRAARRLDNLPGHPGGIRGTELAENLERHLHCFGLAHQAGTVRGLRRERDHFVAELADGSHVTAHAAVMATGTEPVPYDAPGFAELRAAGRAHRDVRTLAQALGGQRVLVVGGGEAAVDTALHLHDRGATVHLVVRGRELAVCPAMRCMAREAALDVRLQHEVEAFAVTGGQVEVRLTHRAHDPLLVDHCVACVGRRPRLELVVPLLGRDAAHTSLATSVPGLYLAGDVTRNRHRYAASAMGDGLRAAELAARHLAGGR